MSFYELTGYFKIWKDPVVHRVYLEVTYKDGTKKRDNILEAFRRRSNAREHGRKYAKSRSNGSESDKIEKVNYRIENIYIMDWI